MSRPCSGARPTVPDEPVRHTGLDWMIGHDELVETRDQGMGDRGQSIERTDVPSVPTQSSTSNFQPAIPLLRLIGQIGATYLVAESPTAYILDQHAAHERVLFEKLMSQHEMKNIPAQALLTPEVVTLPPPSAHLLLTQLPILKHFGFDVDEFGPNTFQVRAMPVLFMGSDPAAALRALVEDFEEDDTPLQNEVEAACSVCLQADGGQGGTGPDQRRAARPVDRPGILQLTADLPAWQANDDPSFCGYARVSIGGCGARLTPGIPPVVRSVHPLWSRRVP